MPAPLNPYLPSFRHALIAARLPILAPEDDEQLLRDVGFSGVSLFYVGFAFRGWAAYA